MLSTEQKLLSGLCHLGIFIGLPFIAPIVVLLLSNDYFVKQQAKEALAFQIAMAIIIVIGGVLRIVLIGFPILLLAGLILLIFPIIATINVVENKAYSYPITGDIMRNIL